jgi:peroxiredoxin
LLDEDGQKDTEILAVAIDSKADLQKMADKISRDDGRPPGFVFLSDPGHRVIDRYGLLNPDGRGWPHPATFVIDRQGVVRWKIVEVDFRVRASNQQILEALARLRG